MLILWSMLEAAENMADQQGAYYGVVGFSKSDVLFPSDLSQVVLSLARSPTLASGTNSLVKIGLSGRRWKVDLNASQADELAKTCVDSALLHTLRSAGTKDFPSAQDYFFHSR
jgi:hypothetical protein